MKIYKKLGEFISDEQCLPLSKQIKKRIRDQLRVFDSEFAADDENSLILLEKGERLHELYEKYPDLEKTRPENSSSVDNYINQVYITAANGAGASVYLPVDAPETCVNQDYFDYKAKYLQGGGPSL